MVNNLNITRDEISRLAMEAHNTGQDKASYIRTELTRKYPGIENSSMRVNGRVYNVLDYLIEDVGSYAPSARG